MKKDEVILARHTNHLRFKNGDMDFMFTWAVGVSQVLGMSPSQIFHALREVRDGDPRGWRNGLSRQGAALLHQAQALRAAGRPIAAGQAYLGATYAYRAALQYTSPRSSDFLQWAGIMEQSFQEGCALIQVPLRAIEIPFAQTTLAGYFLEQDASPRPLVMMIGGGDTFREDLFCFAGYPGWKRGYNVLMVDLPGQGLMPNRGLHFQVDMAAPIRAALDWVESNAMARPEQIAVYGVSGGGYFSAQAVVDDRRIQAWVAATPIFDMASVFTREFGPALRAPAWALNGWMRLASSVNESAEINLAKYAWQFGTADFKTAASGVLQQAVVVDYTRIKIPTLLLLSEGEGAELRRQTLVVYQDLAQRGVPVVLDAFTAADGAEAHCELNNLRMLHLAVFDWLDQRFEHEPGDVRLRC